MVEGAQGTVWRVHALAELSARTQQPGGSSKHKLLGFHGDFVAQAQLIKWPLVIDHDLQVLPTLEVVLLRVRPSNHLAGSPVTSPQPYLWAKICPISIIKGTFIAVTLRKFQGF